MRTSIPIGGETLSAVTLIDNQAFLFELPGRDPRKVEDGATRAKMLGENPWIEVPHHRAVKIAHYRTGVDPRSESPDGDQPAQQASETWVQLWARRSTGGEHQPVDNQ